VSSDLGVVPLAVDYGSLMLKAVWGPDMLTNLPAGRQTKTGEPVRFELSELYARVALTRTVAQPEFAIMSASDT